MGFIKDKDRPPVTCKHGKWPFCCECTYGKGDERDRLEKPKDLVEEMNRLRVGTESMKPTVEDDY